MNQCSNLPSHRSAASKGREPFGWQEWSVVVRISVCFRKWPIAPGGVNQMAVPTGDDLGELMKYGD